MNQSSPEHTEPKAKWVHFSYPVGIMPGIIITPDILQKAMEAEERFRNRDSKPPKPPRRPNIPIGRVALGLGE